MCVWRLVDDKSEASLEELPVIDLAVDVKSCLFIWLTNSETEMQTGTCD